MRGDHGVILGWLSTEGDPERKMPYGDRITNVGVWEEVEFHIGLILRTVGEVINFARRRDDVTNAVSSLGESRRILS